MPTFEIRLLSPEDRDFISFILVIPSNTLLQIVVTQEM